MSRPVQVHYDAIAERWEIGYTDAVGSTLPVDIGDGLSVGRDGAGRLVEIVVDSVSLPAPAMVLITETFGAAVAEVVRSAVVGRDLEVTLTPNLPAPRGEGSLEIAGEPGVPHRHSGSSYTVPAHTGELLLELRVTRGELRLRLPAEFGRPNWWVRVSEVETGALLALAPVRSDDADLTVTLPFGLDLAPEQLHVTVTEQPLAPVGTRDERRHAWVGQLLESAQLARRFRPRRARRLATKARIVALALGNTELRRRADVMLRRQRRRSWGSLGASVLTVVAIATVVQNGRSPDVVVAPTMVAEPIGSVGPAVFRLQDQSSIEASLVGLLPRFEPGQIVPITLEITSVQRWSFGPNPDPNLGPTDTDTILADARRNCLGIINMPGGNINGQIPPFPLKARLDQLDSTDDTRTLERIILGSFDGSTDVVSYTTIKESCRSSEFGATNRFEADTVVRRTPQVIEVSLPENTPPGLWELTVEGPDALSERLGSLRLLVIS
jgi:hypothetical protein